MTLQNKIQALLDKAEPLRSLDPEEAEAAGLPLLVDAINNLRALQAMGKEAADEADENTAKRGPGRPKKAQQ